MEYVDSYFVESEINNLSAVRKQRRLICTIYKADGSWRVMF